MKGTNTVKLQLNTPVSYTRDVSVELTNEATNEKRVGKPYLDGTVVLSNMEAGSWRMKVKHPNLVFDALDKSIKVFPDRPTIIPIVIPRNIFENVPIKDTPEADLSPAQQHLDEATQAAELQANKKAGQPIYADDWNELAQTVASVARSTRELTDLVSPKGHDHPELVEKMEEIQGNLQRMFDAFGASLAQLQRQIQQLALQRKVESALDRVPNIQPEKRRALEDAVAGLQEAWLDPPSVYNARKRRTAQDIQDQFAEVLANQNAEVRNAPEVKDFEEFTRAMATEQPVRTFEEEVQQQQRTTTKSASGTLFEAFKARAGR